MAAAVARWRLELARSADHDTLLQHRDRSGATLDLSSAHPGGLAQFLAGRPTRLSSLFREPDAHAGARRTVRSIRSVLAQLADEHGLDGGYLAVGMLTWRREPGPAGPPGPDVVAPVLLRPLLLTPRGPGQLDEDLAIGDRVLVNPALLRLLARHGVFVEAAELVSLAGSPYGFAPQPALQRIRELTAGLTGVTVTDRNVVGVFVDLGPALVADLDRLADRLPHSPVVAGLAAALARQPGPSATAAGAGAPAWPAPVRPAPARTSARHGGPLPVVHVLDLDPDQRAVLDQVLAGASLAVHAAAGTGATQLVAAVVAGVAAQGRRVLLVAPQRAELTGVADRLAAVGLGVLVDGARADHGADERAWGGAGPGPDDVARPDAARALAAVRERAIQREVALHGPTLPGRATVVEAVTRLTVLAATDPQAVTTVRLGTRPLERLDAATLQGAAQDLMTAAQLGAFDAGVAQTPWFGAHLAGSDEAVSVLAATARLHTTALPRARAAMTRLTAQVGLRDGTCVGDWRRQVELLLAVRRTLDVLTPAVYERDLADLVAATAPTRGRGDGAALSWRDRRRRRRGALDLVRPGCDPGDLHDRLLRAQAQRLAWRQEAAPDEGPGADGPRVPAGLSAAAVLVQSVVEDLGLLETVLQPTPGGGGLLTAALPDLAHRLAALAEDPDTLDRLPRRVAALARLSELGLGPLLDDLGARSVPSEHVRAELELARWASMLAGALAADPSLAEDTDLGAELAAARAALRDAEITAVLDADAVRPVPACTALSPLALPSLPATTAADLVVLVGAHRCGVAEAVLAIARAEQVLVVGDPAGLAPGIVRLGGDDASGGRPAQASVLDAVTPLLPVRTLGSQHRMPSPLADLRTEAGLGPGGLAVPAPDPGAALRLQVVPAGTGPVGADGVVRSPEAEVQCVIDAVIGHARRCPDESLAVLAVTRSHARRVAEALRAELPEHPDVASYFTRKGREPFVVTELARCEDAVRDAVVLTLGWGRTPHGRVLHSFAPLEEAGGARLLSAGLTRARRRLTVVSCLTAEDLDPARLRTPGARALRAVLATAAAGPAPAALVPADAHPLLRDLADRLSATGLDVRRGAAGADLLVRRDGGGATAVLTDLGSAVGARAEAADGSRVQPDLERRAALADRLRRAGWRTIEVHVLAMFTDIDLQVQRVRALVES